MSGPPNNEINNADHAIIKAYDIPTESLKTTIVNSTVDLNVSAFTDSIKIGDGTGTTATISTVGAKKALDVSVSDIAITHQADSIRLGNGTDYLTTSALAGGKTALDVAMNGGSFTAAPSGTTVLVYDTNNITVGTTATVLTYTAPAGVYVQKIYLSGSSIGTYIVYKNGAKIFVQRMSQTQFSSTVDLATSTAFGLQTVSGDIITVTTTNNGTSLAEFDVTLQNLQT